MKNKGLFILLTWVYVGQYRTSYLLKLIPPLTKLHRERSMTEDQSQDPKRIIAKLRAAAPDPNSTMFGMPNQRATDDTPGAAKLEEPSSGRPLQGPGVYQLKRKAHETPSPPPSDTTSVLSLKQQDELWAGLDLDLEQESAQPPPMRTRQTHALLDMLLEHDIHEQHTALGELELPRELLELGEDGHGELSEPTFTEEQLTEAELFGGDFPRSRDRDVRAQRSRPTPEYNTHAPGCTHSTSPGLEERTTPANKRYFLVCEEDGQERRVLLDAKLVELVAQLIFEPAR